MYANTINNVTKRHMPVEREKQKVPDFDSAVILSTFNIDSYQRCHDIKRKAIAMTQCTTDSMSFSRLRGKKIQADFKGGAITSDAGAVLLREVDKRLGLIDAINACIPDPRNPFFVTRKLPSAAQTW